MREGLCDLCQAAARSPPTLPPCIHTSPLLLGCLLYQGGAPEGLKFVDTEEEWVVDPATGQGQWLPVRR